MHTELEVPRELDELILTCLRKDKAERPASVEVVDARLSSIELRQPWTQERARQWWDLHLPGEAHGGEPPQRLEGHHLFVP